ncbi:AAA family ATPase [Desulfurivibrio sp. D14AmB]|uniref:methylation-associated defense system AAA family ATPase MAD3 n=1 Tax=Desulfurivibrio sp. D14AmB TaxID=3374370 RepID=UPI00376ED70D
MITLIEAKNFRCLRYIRQQLGPFHVLVGPNASGKTTFLDVVAFMGSLVSNGLETAVGERTKNFQDLLWQRSGSEFELAIEAAIPEERQSLLRDKDFDTVRYEVSFGIDDNSNEVAINAEKVLLKRSGSSPKLPQQASLFPTSHVPPATIMTARSAHGTQTIINKVSGGNDNFYSEVYQEKGKGWAPAFKLGPRKSALGNLPEDESKFPVATWLKTLLADGVQQFVLNSLLIRKASPPGQGRGFRPDGSNLPWVLGALQKNHPDNFQGWLEHLKTALPDLENIRIIERADDRHRYLVICYRGGLEIPSWMASDGTLRLLALTLPAYLPDFTGVYLIEEPENGIHPRAVETMFQSLSSVYDAQILLASHSPVILSMVQVEDVLCFAKTPEGATDIVLGSRHPALKDWQGATSLGVLFAGGVLG